MAKYIAHASYGEDGIRYQEAGDQTLKEVCVRTWYSHPWNQFFHIENEAVRKQFGNNMIDIANNNNVGYDQSGRNTLLTEGEKVAFDFTKITVKCECDCSSKVIIALLGAIYTVLGKAAYEKAKAILVAGGNCATTSTFKARVTHKELKAIVVVTCHTSGDYTGSTNKAEFGDIYNKSGSHIVAYIDDGKKVDVFKKPDVIYQVYVDGKWLPWVTNYNTVNGNGYAGLYGKDISGIRVRLSNGETVTVQSHILGKPTNEWLPAVTKCDNTNSGYAGIYGRAMDCVAVKALNNKLRYQVHTKGGKWLPWVDEFNINDKINGIAGNYGQPIDGIRIDVK